MKYTLRSLIIAAFTAAAGQAAPFMAIGDGAELFLTGTLGIRADDNIFTAKNATSDVIFDITPGIDLTFGKDQQLQGALTMSVAWSNYSDNSNLNTTLFNGDFVSKYDDGKLKLGFNAGYHELNQNTATVRGLTRRDIFSAAGNAEVGISPITSVGGGITFNHENYHPTVGYTDSDSLTVPINFYYKWTEKLELSVGYQYRDYRVDTLGSDSNDHFFNVGARGEFSPKFTGTFRVGLNQRKLDRGGDENQFGVDASFNYEISPKTQLQFGASNDFGTSPSGDQQKNMTINGRVDSKITEEWSVNAGASWRAIDYGTRTDDFFELTLGTTYVISQQIRIIGGYTYRNYSSDLTASEFKNNVFSIAAAFRY